jgi:2-polyprenyl-3-methyl-5-hydroxy-6-metoxy-1,4-benzoquinol methylase
MERSLEPELLDTLPPESEAARHSRRDLRLINAVMGNHRWIVRTLLARLRPGERVLEIGAGGGELGRKLARSGIIADGLDRCPAPAGWPAHLVWHQEDLSTFGGYANYQAVAANLVLHHLPAPDLAELGRRLRGGPRVLCACEPARSRASQHLFSVLGPLFGAHAVTRHDARISIAAGFLGGELPQALGLATNEWSLHCDQTALGGYRMIALRSRA